jgi:RHS repeat-associated protein
VQFTDDMGVDLRSGQVVRAGGLLTIGSAESPALSLAWFNISGGGAGKTPLFGARYSEYQCTVRTYYGCIGISVVHYEMGIRLTWDRGVYHEAGHEQGNVVTDADGTVWEFVPVPLDNRWFLRGNREALMNGLLRSVRYPNGEMLTYTYTEARKTRSIVSNLGYMLHFEYAQDTHNWSKATLLNLRYEYCDPNAAACSLAGAWPTVRATRSGSVWTGVDSMNRTTIAANGAMPWSITTPEGRRFEWWTEIQGYTPPVSCSITACSGPPLCPGGSVATQIRTSAGVWRYGYEFNRDCRVGPMVAVGRATNPESVTSSVGGNGVESVDGLGRRTLYAWHSLPAGYNGGGQVFKIKSKTFPEGNRVDFFYDSRWNLVRTSNEPKPGSATAAVTTTATFRACSGPGDFRLCNQPETTTDGLGNVTHYTYEPNSGLLATKTSSPVPSPEGMVQYRTRNSYRAYYAYYKRSALGAPEPALAPVYKLERTASCMTRSLDSCAGTADEVIKTYAYDDNLLLKSETTSAGDGSVTAIISYEYDAVGNLIAQHGPMAGQTTRHYYNANRQRYATLEPDPDGGGPLAHPITVTTFDRDGLPVLVEKGYSATPTLETYVALSATRFEYDGAGRKTSEQVYVGGALASRADTGYSLANRVECVATRMNLASTSTGACQLGPEGAYGPDRITRNAYDAAGQLRLVQQGIGTGVQRTERSQTFTSNGKLSTIADGNGNLTTFTYDGLDRPARTLYPHPDSIGVSSGSDYEELLSYDANGNAQTKRLRDGRTITWQYDALNRRTGKTVVALAWGESAHTAYTYDANGMLRTASDSIGWNVSRVYDALGCLRSETDVFGTKQLGCDRAGRLTTLAYADGFTIRFSSLLTGQLAAVWEDGGIGLVTRHHDNLGRLKWVDRGNGASTSYSYVAGTIGPASLVHQISGASVTHRYAYNPARQIVSLQRDNDSYGWPLYGNSNTTYGIDGLNQLRDVAGQATLHDPRGNLTGALSNTWTYTVEDRLATAAGPQGSATLRYDALGRLAEVIDGTAVATRFEYVGQSLVAERNGQGHLLRRYVPGFSSEEPLVWYEGGGSSDRRWLHADHQGSVIAVSDRTGLALAINTFDEYGSPAPSNLGRYQYTGQTWLPELQLHYYKARLYNPKLGRFLQTDPIRFDSGDLNLYAYVVGDPINSTDPDGLAPIIIEESRYSGRGFGGERNLDGTPVRYSRAERIENLQSAREATAARETAAAKGAGDVGRAGKQERLRELGRDDKVGSADRGWIKQEMNSIERGHRSRIRNPPGKELAHERGREAAKGYDYKQSNLQDRDLHRLQHKYDDFGRANAERPLP